MAENPLKIFKKMDPELLTLGDKTKALALNDGALPHSNPPKIFSVPGPGRVRVA